MAIVRWVVVRLARHPSSWLWLGLTAALWLLANELSPVGLTTASSGITGLFYNVAFLGTLTGCSLALIPLSEAQWFLGRLGPGQRLALRAVGILTGGSLGGFATLAIPALTFRMSLLEIESLALPSLLGLTHASLLGLWLLAAPLSASSRALCLPLLAWVLPATFPSASPPLAALRSLIDVSSHFAAPGERPLSTLLASGATLVALAGALWLYESGAGLRLVAPHPARASG